MGGRARVRESSMGTLPDLKDQGRIMPPLRTEKRAVESVSGVLWRRGRRLRMTRCVAVRRGEERGDERAVKLLRRDCKKLKR